MKIKYLALKTVEKEKKKHSKKLTEQSLREDADRYKPREKKQKKKVDWPRDFDNRKALNCHLLRAVAVTL